MDVAALVISIFAVLLSLIVAGFAIGLQWRMFSATSQQLNLIGKENASLGERIAMSLGQLHESATTTRSRLDATMEQLVSGLLARVAPSSDAAGAEPKEIQGDPQGWRIQQAALVLEDIPGARDILEYLAGGPRDARTAGTELMDLGPQAGWDKAGWEWQATTVVGVLKALDMLGYDEDKDVVSLTVEGRQVATRLSEAGRD